MGEVKIYKATTMLHNNWYLTTCYLDKSYMRNFKQFLDPDQF